MLIINVTSTNIFQCYSSTMSSNGLMTIKLLVDGTLYSSKQEHWMMVETSIDAAWREGNQSNLVLQMKALPWRTAKWAQITIFAQTSMQTEGEHYWQPYGILKSFSWLVWSNCSWLTITSWTSSAAVQFCPGPSAGKSNWRLHATRWLARSMCWRVQTLKTLPYWSENSDRSTNISLQQ